MLYVLEVIMVYTVDDIRKKQIYLEAKGPLASRIDFAWQVYNDRSQKNDVRKKALNFLIFAFDLRTLSNLNQQLIELMHERDNYRSHNPQYVPGKTPMSLSFNPGLVVPEQTFHEGQSVQRPIRQALASGEMLDVNNESKDLDWRVGTRFFNAQQRSAFQVHCHKGKFYKDGKVFDSTKMISHGKNGYAAFTLNANGELSVFRHHGMTDLIAHSSMNAGVPVIAAGELQIKKGVLKAITTHSGHYRPTLFNVYRILEHFIQKGVNINQAKMVTQQNPRAYLNLNSTELRTPELQEQLYKTSAKKFFALFDNQLRTQVESINKHLKEYRKESVLSSFFAFKDNLKSSNLTRERKALAFELETLINAFNPTQQTSLDNMLARMDQLMKLLTVYEEKNKALSEKYQKNVGNGRLASSLRLFKEEVAEVFTRENHLKMNDALTALQSTHTIF